MANSTEPPRVHRLPDHFNDEWTRYVNAVRQSDGNNPRYRINNFISNIKKLITKEEDRVAFEQAVKDMENLADQKAGLQKLRDKGQYITSLFATFSCDTTQLRDNYTNIGEKFANLYHELIEYGYNQRVV